MASGPEKGKGEATPREAAERETERRERAAREAAAAGREDDDPREEDGWSQPESSAQKGAPRDEG